ncbi:MAG: LEA type 2 family protein [Halarchaeum sp.]
MDLRAFAFGSALRSVGTVALAVAVVVSGSFALGVLGVPSLVDTQNRFAGVNETTTTVNTSLTVHNPNPVGVRLGGVGVNYTVSMNGREMAYGEKHGVGLGAGNTTLRFQSYLRNERIPGWWASHVRNGEETTVSVAADVRSGTLGRTAHLVPVNRTVTTNVSAQFDSDEDRPVNAGVPGVSDPVAVVRATRGEWGAVTREETPLVTEFDVYNPKLTPLTVSSIGYDVTMNGIDVGAGENEDPVVVPAGETRTVRARTAIENDRLDDWWVSHLRRNQTTDLVIDFYARVDVGGETVRVPLRDLTYEKTIETDIFGTKNESARSTTDTTTSETSTTTSETSTTTSEASSTTSSETTGGGLLS